MKRNLRSFGPMVFFTGSLFFAFGHLSPATLHGVIVADTLDLSIGSDIDMKKMSTRFKNFAGKSGLQYKEIILQGKNRTQKNVSSTVQNLQVGKDDTVIFYYTGHGYRFESDKSPWPSLAMADDKGIDSVWVLKTLVAKKPRFILVMVDACNNKIPDNAIPTVRNYSSEKTSLPESYKKLFAQYKGIIITSGSSPGQYSFGGRPQGGIYTGSFLESLDQELMSKNPDWNNIFSRAVSPKLGGKQKPQYKINPDLGNLESESPGDGSGVDDQPSPDDEETPGENDGSDANDGSDEEETSPVQTLDLEAIIALEPESLSEDCGALQDMIGTFHEAHILLDEKKSLKAGSQELASLQEIISAMAVVYMEAGDKEGAKPYKQMEQSIKKKKWKDLSSQISGILADYVEGFNQICPIAEDVQADDNGSGDDDDTQKESLPDGEENIQDE